ncbi:unnamed protein product [Lymnaea stagnalis]|uniref:Cationic amino acid transporter n=1 Tax=Lymnaea stagnalis TaxID=6523 RepID=A0AAV2HC02_LYMST
MATTMLSRIKRKRPLDKMSSHNGHDAKGGAEMEKCLTTVDLVSLGVGSCCGAGMYLTAGIIAAQKAGPGGILSIVLAGLGSILTGVHYAELAGICPHTSGSAYMYTYVTVGELLAFIIGWGLIVEYVIGTAAASVALSETFHSITEKRIFNFFTACTDTVGLPHIDFVAAAVCLLLMWLLASGVQMSARVNNVLNGINFIVWAVFVSASFYLGSASNWSKNGGFLPYGYVGVLSAIPTAFYAFVGFDGLATTGAECKNPVKSIPISIVLSIIINIIVFTNVVAGLTFNMPYNLLTADTAMLDVFAKKGYPALKYIVAVGAVAGLFAATFGSLFPLPRVLQAMAQDGLIFRYFASVCPTRHTALRATIVSGLVAAFLAAFINLTLLIELVLIGTLLAYVIVTYATLIIRYVDLCTSQHIPLVPVFSPVSASETYGLHESYGSAGAAASIKRKTSDTDLHHQEIDVKSNINLLHRQPSHTDTVSGVTENGGVVNIGFHDDAMTHCSRRDSANSLNKRHEDSKDSELQENVYVFKDNPEKTSSFNMYISPLPKERIALKRHLMCVSFIRLTVYVSQNMYVFLLGLYGSMFLMCAVLSNLFELLEKKNVLVIICLGLLMVTVTIMSVVLMFIPQLKHVSEGFKAPLVPLITVLTAGINIYLMTSLHWVTWLLFLAWMLIGIVIYLAYGTRNSTLNGQFSQQWDETEDDVFSTDNVGSEVVNASSVSEGESIEDAPLLNQEKD